MKLKYKYRVHHLLENYPTEEDALFDISNYLQERDKLGEEFSDAGIKAAFQKKLPEQEISMLLESLVNQEFLTKREGSGKRSYFRISRNPFI